MTLWDHSPFADGPPGNIYAVDGEDAFLEAAYEDLTGYDIGDEVEFADDDEEEEEEEEECGRTYITRGSDPWRFTCDLAPDHTGDHSMTNPMGPDTPTFTWRAGHLNPF